MNDAASAVPGKKKKKVKKVKKKKVNKVVEPADNQSQQPS
jgi:hypothetical protein